MLNGREVFCVLPACWSSGIEVDGSGATRIFEGSSSPYGHLHLLSGNKHYSSYS
jgi:hypothetical protein